MADDVLFLLQLPYQLVLVELITDRTFMLYKGGRGRERERGREGGREREGERERGREREGENNHNLIQPLIIIKVPFQQQHNSFLF